MPRPRGGDWLADEIRTLKKHNVDLVVSLLTPEEEAELQLDAEAARCAREGIGYLALPIPDRSVPPDAMQAERVVDEMAQRLQRGQSVLIHCRAGIGRSAMIAAWVLARLGVDLGDAWARISRARGFSVPDTPEQREWVRRRREEA